MIRDTSSSDMFPTRVLTAFESGPNRSAKKSVSVRCEPFCRPFCQPSSSANSRMAYSLLWLCVHSRFKSFSEFARNAALMTRDTSSSDKFWTRVLTAFDSGPNRSARNSVSVRCEPFWMPSCRPVSRPSSSANSRVVLFIAFAPRKSELPINVSNFARPASSSGK